MRLQYDESFSGTIEADILHGDRTLAQGNFKVYLNWSILYVYTGIEKLALISTTLNAPTMRIVRGTSNQFPLLHSRT